MKPTPYPQFIFPVMKEMHYDFVELESDKTFEELAKAFSGTLVSNTIQFNTPHVQGSLIKRSPEEGLWIRKWKLTVFNKIILHRKKCVRQPDHKYSIIYFINPALFRLKQGQRPLHLRGTLNRMFASDQVEMDFSVVSNQLFYVVDVTFTGSWIVSQLADGDVAFRRAIDNHLSLARKKILMESCEAAEYKVLNEIDSFDDDDWENKLNISSRIYQLIAAYFSKLTDTKKSFPKRAVHHFDQVVAAERALVADLKGHPSLPNLAKSNNLSVSSLTRQFKLMYGKSIRQYHLEKRLEKAKMLLEERRYSVGEIAEMVGYKQVSAFIQSFVKQYHYKPGDIKGAWVPTRS